MDIPSAKVCEELLARCGAPERVALHCRAVADYARSLALLLNRAGLAVNPDAVFAAGLLHDCMRTRPEHEKAAAEFVAGQGYPGLGELIAAHHDLPHPERLDEAAILYYADKRFQGEAKVTLTTRFLGSLEKCKTPEARAARQRRLSAALLVEQNIASILGVTDF